MGWSATPRVDTARPDWKEPTMRGSTYRRCECRAPDTGRKLTDCPRLSNRRHGTWAYSTCLPTSAGRRQLRRQGFDTRQDADAFGGQVRDLLTLADDDRLLAARIGDLIFANTAHRGALPSRTELARRLGTSGQVDATGQTLGDYLTAWLAGKRKLRPSTRRAATAHVAFFTQHLGGIPLHRLTRDHVNAAIAAKIAASEHAARTDAARRAQALRDGRPAPPGKPKTVISSASLARMIATLRSALTAAVVDRRITHNPAAHIELPDHRRPEIHPWSPEEAGHFLHTTRRDRLGPLYELTMLEGLRRGEAAGLQWSDLTLDPDTHRGSLRIRRQRVDVAGRIHEGPPKTRSGERHIELGRRSVTVLLDQHARQATERAAAGPAWTDTGYIFTDPQGRPLRPETISRHFHRLTTIAELPHSASTTCATCRLASSSPPASTYPSSPNDSATPPSASPPTSTDISSPASAAPPPTPPKPSSSATTTKTMSCRQSPSRSNAHHGRVRAGPLFGPHPASSPHARRDLRHPLSPRRSTSERHSRVARHPASGDVSRRDTDSSAETPQRTTAPEAARSTHPPSRRHPPAAH
jgi:integrase